MRDIDILLNKHNVPDGPGYSVAVYQNGKMKYSGATGLADIEHGAELTADSIFDIASISKQFTAAALVILEMEGLVSLDDQIIKYIPDLPSYCNDITLSQLLNHTSGIRDYNDLLFKAGVQQEDAVTEQIAISMITRQQSLEFTPGEKFQYSNTGYFLISLVVKNVSGKSLKLFANEEIFMPLGMVNTYFCDQGEHIIPTIAKAYCEGEKEGFELDMAKWQTLGDGAVFTNVKDLLKWDDIFYRQDTYWHEVAERLQRKGTLNSGEVINYAQGLEYSVYKGLKTISHDGWWGGYLSELIRFPEQKTTIAVLANFAESDPIELAKDIADIVLSEHVTPEQPFVKFEQIFPFPEEVLIELKGTYEFLHEPDDCFDVKVNDKKVTLAFDGSEETLFYAGNGKVVNESNFLKLILAKGDHRVISWLGSKTGDSYEVRKIRPYKPIYEDLSAIAGKYYSKELASAFEIVLIDNRLILKSNDDEENELSFFESDLLKSKHEELSRIGVKIVNGVVFLYVGVHQSLNIKYEQL